MRPGPQARRPDSNPHKDESPRAEAENAENCRSEGRFPAAVDRKLRKANVAHSSHYPCTGTGAHGVLAGEQHGSPHLISLAAELAGSRIGLRRGAARGNTAGRAAL